MSSPHLHLRRVLVEAVRLAAGEAVGVVANVWQRFGDMSLVFGFIGTDRICAKFAPKALRKIWPWRWHLAEFDRIICRIS